MSNNYHAWWEMAVDWWEINGMFDRKYPLIDGTRHDTTIIDWWEPTPISNFLMGRTVDWWKSVAWMQSEGPWAELQNCSDWRQMLVTCGSFDVGRFSLLEVGKTSRYFQIYFTKVSVFFMFFPLSQMVNKPRLAKTRAFQCWCLHWAYLGLRLQDLGLADALEVPEIPKHNPIGSNLRDKPRMIKKRWRVV